ncbi:required for drug-induced death protein 1 [Ctenodactylus gundi]
MAVGAGLTRRGPLWRARARRGEDTDAILEQLECGDEAAEGEAGGRRSGTGQERRAPLAAPREEPATGDKPRKKHRRLRKYGKNVGKVITKGCRYLVIGLQGFAAAYSAPFGVATSVVSFVR